jgi:predicted nucleic acid-binding protein
MIAVDTNVLIYCCDSGDTHRQQVALDVVSSATDGVLLWQVACEFVAASRKLGAQGFTARDAWDRLAEFLGLFPLVLPARGVLDRARNLHTHHGWSFWDATLVGACLESGVTRLYSEDLPSRTAIETLVIVNPFA